jgi:hypothetical protein
VLLTVQRFCAEKGIDPSVTCKEDIIKVARWYDLFCQGKAVSAMASSWAAL